MLILAFLSFSTGKKISACVAKVCPLGTNCKEVNGKAECRRPTPTCAAVLCPVGTLCVIENGNAICKK